MDKFLKIAFSALCLLVGTAAAMAQTAGVSMTKFEQTFLDSQAAIALRNNLPDTVYSVTYSLEFLSSKGVPEDFQEYTSKVTIPPGMTKKVEIPAYCHDRSYEYYKTAKYPELHPTFSVNYKYISADIIGTKKVQARTEGIANVVSQSKVTPRTKTVANSVGSKKVRPHTETTDPADIDIYDPDTIDAVATAADGSDSPQNTGFSDIIMSISLIFAISLVIGMYVLVAQMARNRGRNAAVWVALSLFMSPFLVMFILLIAGRSNNYYR